MLPSWSFFLKKYRWIFINVIACKCVYFSTGKVQRALYIITSGEFAFGVALISRHMKREAGSICFFKEEKKNTPHFLPPKKPIFSFPSEKNILFKCIFLLKVNKLGEAVCLLWFWIKVWVRWSLAGTCHWTRKEVWFSRVWFEILSCCVMMVIINACRYGGKTVIHSKKMHVEWLCVATWQTDRTDIILRSWIYFYFSFQRLINFWVDSSQQSQAHWLHNGFTDKKKKNKIW